MHHFVSNTGMGRPGMIRAAGLILSILLLAAPALAGMDVLNGNLSVVWEQNATLNSTIINIGNGTISIANQTAPASAGAAGWRGQFILDGNHLYYHNGSSWTRVPLTSW